MTVSESSAQTISAEIKHELEHEQAHVDRVYAELAKAGARAALIEAEGRARGRSSRTGEVREEEITGLFERDALVFNAGRRRRSLETQFEGLVFGRLDLEHDRPDPSGETREIRYVGRLGVRDDDYEPLVIDWRAPAAAPFYQATPVDPKNVIRRRVLRSRDQEVIGVEDDLMVPEAPEDMVVIGDGALMAALTRSRGGQMRDIVATIQQHQDEAIRASARGVTEITGGPGTGKTVVALHRAAYLLYSERRKYENGGVLVVGPSAAYTAYIERVLPSLGEDTVTLRSLGDVIEGMTGTRLDSPAAAAVKGSLRIRPVLARAARDLPPEAPTRFRAMISGHPVHIDSGQLQAIRRQVLRNHQHNNGGAAALNALGEAAWTQVRPHAGKLEKSEFIERFGDHLEVESFMQQWWPQLDPREVLLWMADAGRLQRYSDGILSPAERDELRASFEAALLSGTWSVADAALVDDLSARLGLVVDKQPEERGFYEVELLDDTSSFGVNEVNVSGGAGAKSEVGYQRNPTDARERLLHGRIGKWNDYAHVLVDEAQDLSPMQWRMVGRRGRASWTVVGDAAQSSWPDEAEALAAREEAFGSKERRRFHMNTNYRNAREIFVYAADVVRREVPDADIPDAVRETGVQPRELSSSDLVTDSLDAARTLLDEVEGLVAVVAPAKHAAALSNSLGDEAERIVVIDPMSTKGLEYDATVIVDPDEIVRESPGGIRVLYVALTRAAHRMTVVRPA
ncbi:UvrD-helicase domain-containing protein [Yimella sp. cx-51]|uniref:HelD family protein n=1 Tax=Yimella sp. cx-51 TaxID=2770551 RepID=UPI00165D67E4|nr:UvrD-helicase domain-containing protein [Yimella sp. cx-51]MBC9955731.1 AAA family ATPase [Yimella sp. cx-51]QTH37704.1 AAA family ATPase [Yimella sp. cx-51]